MNLSRNKSFANESVGIKLPVVPAVEEESFSGDAECSPRERSSNIGEAGMTPNNEERQALIAAYQAQKGSRRSELVSKVTVTILCLLAGRKNSKKGTLREFVGNS